MVVFKRTSITDLSAVRDMNKSLVFILDHLPSAVRSNRPSDKLLRVKPRYLSTVLCIVSLAHRVPPPSPPTPDGTDARPTMLPACMPMLQINYTVHPFRFVSYLVYHLFLLTYILLSRLLGSGRLAGCPSDAQPMPTKSYRLLLFRYSRSPVGLFERSPDHECIEGGPEHLLFTTLGPPGQSVQNVSSC